MDKYLELMDKLKIILKNKEEEKENIDEEVSQLNELIFQYYQAYFAEDQEVDRLKNVLYILENYKIILLKKKIGSILYFLGLIVLSLGLYCNLDMFFSNISLFLSLGPVVMALTFVFAGIYVIKDYKKNTTYEKSVIKNNNIEDVQKSIVKLQEKIKEFEKKSGELSARRSILYSKIPELNSCIEKLRNKLSSIEVQRNKAILKVLVENQSFEHLIDNEYVNDENIRNYERMLIKK